MLLASSSPELWSAFPCLSQSDRITESFTESQNYWGWKEPLKIQFNSCAKAAALEYIAQESVHVGAVCVFTWSCCCGNFAWHQNFMQLWYMPMTAHDKNINHLANWVQKKQEPSHGLDVCCKITLALFHPLWSALCRLSGSSEQIL